MKPFLNLLKLENVPIWEQLKIEEALLRVDENNWCLINTGTPSAIVMGVSGKPEKFLNKPLVQKYQLPVWKRFSGGGTVVVDESTLFVTMICNSVDTKTASCPHEVHSFAEKIYKSVFPKERFALKENDYVFDNRKFGGNAQYLCKKRWLHHTSFLWDYDQKKMQCLLMPPKIPVYRENRNHHDFLCTLKSCGFSKTEVSVKLQQELESSFVIKPVSFKDVLPTLDREHRKLTTLLTF